MKIPSFALKDFRARKGSGERHFSGAFGGINAFRNWF